LGRVAGIITGAPQTALSHTNVRAKQNGIPNAYVRDAAEKYSEFIDQPVSWLCVCMRLKNAHYITITHQSTTHTQNQTIKVVLTTNETGVHVRRATPAELQAAIDARRPHTSPVPPPNVELAQSSLLLLRDARAADSSSVGAKAGMWMCLFVWL
jgi:hypothetical protein